MLSNVISFKVMESTVLMKNTQNSEIVLYPNRDLQRVPWFFCCFCVCVWGGGWTENCQVLSLR